MDWNRRTERGCIEAAGKCEERVSDCFTLQAFRGAVVPQQVTRVQFLCLLAGMTRHLVGPREDDVLNHTFDAAAFLQKSGC